MTEQHMNAWEADGGRPITYYSDDNVAYAIIHPPFGNSRKTGSIRQQ